MSNRARNSRQLDFEQVKTFLPQRFPFLMIDRVEEIEIGRRLVALKNLTGNEWFYQGHFPERAVTPGVMICEAIAQASIIFFRKTFSDHPANTIYLLGAMKMRFLKPVYPGEQLRIEIVPIKITTVAGILSGIVRSGDEIIARGELSLSASSTRIHE